MFHSVRMTVTKTWIALVPRKKAAHCRPFVLASSIHTTRDDCLFVDCSRHTRQHNQPNKSECQQRDQTGVST